MIHHLCNSEVPYEDGLLLTAGEGRTPETGRGSTDTVGSVDSSVLASAAVGVEESKPVGGLEEKLSVSL